MGWQLIHVQLIGKNTSIAKKCMCRGCWSTDLKKTQQQTDMAFSLKVMGIITFILFCTKKDNKKMRHTICKWKRIVSVFKYIHVHPIDWFFLYLCNYRPLFLHDKWIMAVSVHKANYFRESVRLVCLVQILFKMTQSPYTKLIFIQNNFIFL